MKTKFTHFLQIKKQKLDEIEREIQRKNQEIVAKQTQIQNHTQEFQSLQEPKSGIYQEFLTFHHHKMAYYFILNQAKAELVSLQGQKEQFQEDYKKANIEYEKAKYLDSLEIKKEIKKQKRQENLEIDEISVLLFNHKGS